MLLEEELAVETKVEPKFPECYEVVRGRIVEVSPMSFYAGEVANDVKVLIDAFLADHPLGRTRIEQHFAIPLPDDDTRIMRPDLAFISYERWVKDRPIRLKGLGLPVVPELAVEVISPTDKAEEVMAKMVEYFRGGVSTVWQIYPLSRFSLVFEGQTSVRLVREDEPFVLRELPGLSIRLADVLPLVEVEDG